MMARRGGNKQEEEENENVTEILMWQKDKQALSPVLQSLRPRNLGLQAPSNLSGSTKNTHFFPLLNLSQRYNIKYWEKPC